MKTIRSQLYITHLYNTALTVIAVPLLIPITSHRCRTQRTHVSHLLRIAHCRTVRVHLRIALQTLFRHQSSPIAPVIGARLTPIAQRPIAIRFERKTLRQTTALDAIVAHMHIASIRLPIGDIAALFGRMIGADRQSGTVRIGERVAFDALQRIVLDDGLRGVAAVARASHA